jgi:esterase/lipase
VKTKNKTREPILEQDIDEVFSINHKTYKWTYKAMEVLFDFLKLNIHVHGDETIWNEGHIFLFNHFARFEAIIPQYIIYQKTQHYSHSIATKELFSKGSLFSKYLKNLGGIPNDAENLLYQVSKNILNNHKLVVFPEGGIVKDRRVVNESGEYHVFSRSSKIRRKHHTGPAVLGLSLAIFKATVRQLANDGELARLSRWASEIGYKNHRDLLRACEEKTKIVPCCITFFPLRVSDNALKKGLEFISDDITERLSEELLIEGNLLLKESDMDIQLGEPIIIEDYIENLENTLLSILTDKSSLSLKQLFEVEKDSSSIKNKLFKFAYLRSVKKIRDCYMQRIYSGININIAHITSSLIMQLVNSGMTTIPRDRLHRLIYIAIKDIQQQQHLHLHPSLRNPTIYNRILYKKQKDFEQILRTAKTAELIESKGGNYIFSNKLVATSHFDSIRYTNPIAVYANEISPIKAVHETIQQTLSQKLEIPSEEIAALLFDDELREFEYSKHRFLTKSYSSINSLQTATEPATPYLLNTKNGNGHCIVLIHGLLATPAELRSLADKLALNGFTVIGVRLKGHGTSPWDLERTNWQDWYQSVKQSLRIAQFLSPNVHLIGFSCGSLLAIMLAAHKQLNIKSLVLCSTPLLLKDRLAPLSKAMHLGNKIIKALSFSNGAMPFKENNSENPEVNYTHIPISSIKNLLQLTDIAKLRIKRIQAPTLCMQAKSDPVVKKESMKILTDELKTTTLKTAWVHANHHGIIYQNTESCHQTIIDFILSQSN